MNTTIRHSAVVVLLLLYAACGDSGPTSPTRTTSQQAVPVPAPPAPPVTIPPLSGPSRTYVFDHELLYRVSDYTKNSRFVLYDSGAFALQEPGLEWRGPAGLTQRRTATSSSTGKAGASPVRGKQPAR